MNMHISNQAGIYAGEGGYDIEVGENTDLKGAVRRDLLILNHCFIGQIYATMDVASNNNRSKLLRSCGWYMKNQGG